MRHLAGSVVMLMVLTPPALADSTLTDAQLNAKREVVGGGLALSYGLDHCDIATTAKQRADFAAKLKALKQETGLTGALSDGELKTMIGIKSADDEKSFCTGLQLTYPGMITGFLAETPPKDWSKGQTAAAPSTSPAAPAPAAPPATPAKTVVGDWEVERDESAPTQCTISRDYHDKEDSDAENAIVIRKMPSSFMIALSYAKWNFTAGEKTSAAFVAGDSILNGDAQWTADKTGKVLVTELPLDQQQPLSQATELTIKFSDGDADFDVPKIGDAIDAMNRCSQAK